MSEQSAHKELNEYKTSCCVLLALTVLLVIYIIATTEKAWFQKKPERMAVGNVFAGTTYGLQGKLRGDFFVPHGVLPEDTPPLTGYIVKGIH